MTTTTTFLMPKGTEDPRLGCSYPTDDVCRQIALALETHNWKVAGVTVTMYSYRSFTRLNEISGVGWRIRLCRRQGDLGNRWSDFGGVSSIYMPGAALMLDADDPYACHYCVYTGRTWEADRGCFMDLGYVPTRETTDPGKFTWYTASCMCGRGGRRGGLTLPHPHPEIGVPPVFAQSVLYDNGGIANPQVRRITPVQDVQRWFVDKLRDVALASILD